MTDARRALLGDLIDHAPLFPPASLPLDEALAEHRWFLAGRHGWLLRRFVVPASRLRDLGDVPLRLSVIWDTSFGPDGRVEAIEMTDVPGREHSLTQSVELYKEVPPDFGVYRLRGLAWAKVRCGPEPPPTEALAGFIHRCREARVPFKATAGLHHALPTDGQHGFLNLLAAAIFGDEEAALEERDVSAFQLDADGFSWRDYRAGVDEIEAGRRRFVAFGSCSAQEPADELRALGFL